MDAPGPHPRAVVDDAARLRAEDLDLVRAVRRGDPAGWQRLLAAYQDKIYALCYRIGGRRWADDLAQDAMVRVIQGLDSYDGRSRLSTWIYRVTANVCLSRLRSEKYRSHASLDAPVSGAGGRGRSGGGGGGGGGSDDREGLGAFAEETRELRPEARVQAKEEARRVLDAAARLDIDQRAILFLRDQQGLDYEQIAEVLETAVGTVKSRLFRARAALRQEVERHADRPDPD